jgi:hypothetical protein
VVNKLDAYGVSESALKLIKNYLSNRKQCVKIGNIMSEWEDIYKGQHDEGGNYMAETETETEKKYPLFQAQMDRLISIHAINKIAKLRII